MNELQQVLNSIKQDKNTNLLPGNLRDNVTCLGVEGTAEVPIPIYATTDYSIKELSLLHYGDSTNSIYHINNFYITVSYDTPSRYEKIYVDIYEIENDNLVHKYSYSRSFGLSRTYIYPFASKENTLYFYSSSSDSGTSIEKMDLTAETLQLVSISSSMNNSVIWVVDSKLLIGRNYSLYFDISNEKVTKIESPDVNLTVRYCGGYYVTGNTNLWKFDTNTISWVDLGVLDNITLNSSVCFTKDESKVFIDGDLYSVINDSVGELLKENVYNYQNTGSSLSDRYLVQINDKYFGLINGSRIYSLYEFDNSSNTLTLVSNIDCYFSSITQDICSSSSSTQILSYYVFNKGNVQIGIIYNGNNLYFSSSQIAMSSSNVLQGTIMYDKNHNQIIGTMPNNGELNITPTTENQNIPEGYTSGGTVLGDENLKSENIKKNVSIFGVTGSLESSSGQMKLFKTQEEMQADPDAKEGDLAVVYDDSPMKMEAGVYYNGSLTMYFPKVVTLDEAVSSAISNKQWTMLDYNDVGYSLTSSSFKFGTYDYMEDDITGEYATYTSSDGITYTRTTDKDSITFELEYHVVLSTSHSIVGNFLLLENGVFRGLYKYDTKLNELKSKGYINPVVTDEVLSYDKLSSVDINTILPCLKTIYNNDNKSYGRYIVVIKNNGDIFAYDYKDGNSSTDYWTFPGIICDGNKIYISQNYTSSTTHIFRKHKLNTEDGTVESETLSNLSTYQYQTVSDELNKDDIITILTDNGVSSTITVGFFGENSGTDNLNTNKVDLKMAYAEESKYYSAKTQFTIEKPNELLPGLIAYGKSGDVTGDGTIYNNLDCREILKKLYGENNLIYSTDSSKTYACSKDVNNNQIMLSGEVDKLTQFIKLSENIESSTKTAIVRNTSTENYITYDGTCEITINKSSGKLLVKNMNTEEEHIHSFVSNPYSVDIRILPNDILLIVQQDNDIPTAIVYKIDLTTQSMTSMTLDCNVSYSSSYKDLEFANVDAINKKLYFTSNVQTASTSMKFKFGYINLTNMSAVLLVDKSVTFSSSYPHSQELSTIFTQNGNVVVYMGRYYNSKDYASMTIYSRENDSIVLNVSEKQVNTANFSNLFKTYCNVVAYDDGTTLYWDSNRLNKSSLEYSFDGTDYTVPYFMDYSGKYAFSYFTGDSIIIFDLEKNTNLSIPFPNVSVAIVDDKYNHSAAGFNCAPIIKDDKLQVLFTDHYFISPIYNVEEASILDYEYMLVCSVTSTNAFYPQYSYSKINSGTISSEEYNTALNTAKQIEGSAE